MSGVNKLTCPGCGIVGENTYGNADVRHCPTPYEECRVVRYREG